MSIYSCTSKMPRYIVAHMMVRYAKACPNEKEIYKLTCEKNYGFTPNLNVRKLPSLYVISNFILYTVLQLCHAFIKHQHAEYQSKQIEQVSIILKLSSSVDYLFLVHVYLHSRPDGMFSQEFILVLVLVNTHKLSFSFTKLI